MLTALGREERMTDAACEALPQADRSLAAAAVAEVVADKIESYLGSAGRAPAKVAA